MGSVGTVSVAFGIVTGVSGVSGSARVGTVLVKIDASFALTGVVATGFLGYVNIWGQVDDNQAANWQNIGNIQSPLWAEVNDAQDADWQEIAA